MICHPSPAQTYGSSLPSDSLTASYAPGMTIELGRLRPVLPRDVWAHEALNFTPWLLDNVDVLSDLLGMDLVLERAEHPVGGFSLDLLGHDEAIRVTDLTI